MCAVDSANRSRSPSNCVAIRPSVVCITNALVMKQFQLSRDEESKADHLRLCMPRSFVYRVAFIIVLGFFLTGLSLHATLLPGFTEAQVGSNLGGSPTAMDFAPDGRLFVCLQSGQVRVIENGNLLATPFVTVPTTENGERGLLGIAFDPGFAGNHFVYVYYTVSNAPIHNRVSRYTANGNVAVSGSETVILDLDNLSTATNHNGGAIHFGSDGKLYIGVGENANPANSQSVANRLGKLLRINADGTIPSDNPTSFPNIAGSPTGANRAIWAVGLRNPFTFGVQPGTGRLFINDVGQNTWEEINDGIAGSNYGWNICEGDCSPPNSNFRDPLLQYSHDDGCAIVGGAFYNPSVNQFPAGYVGKYFFGDLCGAWIRVMDTSNNTASDFATGIGSPVDIKVGPEGSLYYLDQGSGQVWKISAISTPTPTATPITVSGTVTYCSNPAADGVPGVTLTLTGSGSGSILSDSSGNYQFTSLTAGGSYVVTPSKAALPPGTAGINTVDVVAVQRHFLAITPLSQGCQRTAADVNGDTSVNTSDVIALQRFALGLSSGIANTGKYRFNPPTRSYPSLTSNQTGQDYDAMVIGDVASGFVHRPDGGSAVNSAISPVTVTEIFLPEITVDEMRGAFIAAVNTSSIDGNEQLIGFQGDLTFDERVVAFDGAPVQKAGLTGGNWNVSGNVLSGEGPIRTLRVSAYSNDFIPLSGAGTLFELRMINVSKVTQGTQLLWASHPNEFMFIDVDLNTRTPVKAHSGVVGPTGTR